MSDGTIGPCRRCGREKYLRPRGLCWTCYYAPGVREQYPSPSKFATKGEPTEAELDAMIAEQMQRLPPWWWDEQPEYEVGQMLLLLARGEAG